MKEDSFIGRVFGKLTVLRLTDEVNKYNRKLYEYECECGSKILRTKSEVTNPKGPRSCGCNKWKGTPKDITGNRYSKLVAIENTGEKSNNGDYLWKCQCDCGNVIITTIGRLNFGHTKSCGCIISDIAKTRENYHGMTKTKEYKSWCKIRERCLNENDIEYKSYGGVGITVCDEWKYDFKKFYEDMGNAPSKDHSVDRIDLSRGYEKDNCRWANPFIQARNKNGNKGSSSKYKGVHYDYESNKWSAKFTIRAEGKGYGGRIYRYNNEDEAAAAYNLATKLVFEDFDPSIYNLNNTPFPEELVNTEINFFKKHIPILKEIANKYYKD